MPQVHADIRYRKERVRGADLIFSKIALFFAFAPQTFGCAESGRVRDLKQGPALRLASSFAMSASSAMPTAFMTAKAVGAGIKIPVPIMATVPVMAVEIKFEGPIRGKAVVVVVVVSVIVAAGIGRLVIGAVGTVTGVIVVIVLGVGCPGEPLKARGQCQEYNHGQKPRMHVRPPVLVLNYWIIIN
ncbi:MAG: hypothetical protein ABSE08_12660 [Syntrophobacteraceae bacterium]